ncbi:MAG: ATP synthase F0 subunit B [Kofleriaceae bacterium]
MNPTALVEVATGNQPLIDIDLTVLLQLVLFAVMFFVANKLLFQPFLKLRAKRIAGIDGARGEAERMSAEADGKLADYEAKLATTVAKAAEEQRKIRAEAAAHEREVSDKARTSAQRALEEATATVTRETETARAELVPQAQLIARRMAKQLLGREIA